MDGNCQVLSKPLKVTHIETNEGVTTIKGTVRDDPEEINTYLINDRILLRNPFSPIKENNQMSDADWERAKMLDSSEEARNVLMKRSVESEESESQASRASLPFLPDSSSSATTSESSSSSLPSLPGLPDLSSGGTPTAVIGGFSLIIMPMPGLTPSNIGSALQMSQLVPGVSSLTG